jgi:hypothetical protein
MKKHLKGRHKITIERALSKNQVAVNKQLRQLYQQAEANGERDEFDAEVLEACLDTSVITEALILLSSYETSPLLLLSGQNSMPSAKC